MWAGRGWAASGWWLAVPQWLANPLASASERALGLRVWGALLALCLSHAPKVPRTQRGKQAGHSLKRHTHMITPTACAAWDHASLAQLSFSKRAPCTQVQSGRAGQPIYMLCPPAPIPPHPGQVQTRVQPCRTPLHCVHKLPSTAAFRVPKLRVASSAQDDGPPLAPSCLRGTAAAAAATPPAPGSDTASCLTAGGMRPTCSNLDACFGCHPAAGSGSGKWRPVYFSGCIGVGQVGGRGWDERPGRHWLLDCCHAGACNLLATAAAMWVGR